MRIAMAVGCLFVAACAATPPGGGDGGGGSGGGGGATECTAPQTLCSGACVDTKTDDLHCGDCGTACPSAQACAGGACYDKSCGGRQCPATHVCVGNTCVERACFGVLCPAGQLCGGGLCRPTQCTNLSCGPGEVCVNDACVDAACAGVLCPPATLCSGGLCVQDTCMNGVKDGLETDRDCGGVCAPCAEGKGCAVAQDCTSLSCPEMTCAPPSCDDGMKNGAESDVDCGAPCSACGTDKQCLGAAGCQSGVCTAGRCQAPSCTDTVKNGTESDVDCGGQGNGCPRCALSQVCTAGADCTSTVCLSGRCSSAQCVNNMKDGTETDTDCGGNCPGCAVGRVCLAPTDCATSICDAGTCRAAACTDGVKNGLETDTDCGGGCPNACAVDGGCVAAIDCQSKVCGLNARCKAPSCTDAVQNGGESDVDCGGATSCPRCGGNASCTTGPDCLSGTCSSLKCTTPPLFGPSTQYLAQNAPSGAAIADLDNDGNLDFAVTNYGNSSFSVFYGNGLGGFTTAYNVGLAPAGWEGPLGTALLDVTGDGVKDLITSQSANNPGGGCRLAILPGLATRGLFGAPIYITGATDGGNSGCGTQLLTGLIDGDNVPDILLTDHTSWNVGGDQKGGQFWRGSANAPYAGLTLVPGIGPWAKLKDLDGDGKLDLVSHSERTTELRVAYGDGDGGFTQRFSLVVAGGGGAVETGSFNADPYPDLLVCTPTPEVFGIHFGTDAGTWTSPYTSSVRAPIAILVGDFDGDGVDDVISGPHCCSSLGVFIWRGLGNGQLAAPVQILPQSGAIYQPGFLLTADFNKDGKPDLLLVDNSYGAGALVWLNQRP